MFWTERIPPSGDCRGIKGPNLPVPVPLYTTDVTGAAVNPIGNVVGVALEAVPAELV